MMALVLSGCGTPAAEPAPEAAPDVAPEEVPPVQEPAPVEPAPPAAGEPTEEPPPEVLNRAELSIVNFSFNPRSVTVLLGGTVVWTHEDSAPHTVTSDDGLFDAGTLAEGGSFRFTFDVPGTYTYHCEIHPRMTGVIEVVEAGEAAVGSDAAAVGGEDYYSD